MAIQLQKSEEFPILILRFSGIVEHKEHQPIIPLIERELSEDGRLNLLLDMRDLVFWQPAAIWEELRFDAELLDNFHRIAVVSDRRHHRWVAFFVRHLAAVEVRYFHNSDISSALNWLVSGSRGEGLGLGSSAIDSEVDEFLRPSQLSQENGESHDEVARKREPPPKPWNVDSLSLILQLLAKSGDSGQSKAVSPQEKFHSSRMIPFFDI